MKPILCIAGPTASGKSAWAVNLAKTYNGEVINADSMQVYRDLSVISARPNQSEMDGIPHHLFGHIDGAIRYSVGEWLRDVEPVILDVLARDKVPILTGGTGLYFKALTEGLANIPEPSIEAVEYAATFLDTNGVEALRALAFKLDPVATIRVLGHDPQRLLRIVTVAMGTNKPLSVWQASTRPVIPQQYWHGAILLPDRARLYDRINLRFDSMVDRGGLDEVRKLAARKLDESLPVMKAIGVPSLIAHIHNTKELAEAIRLAKRDTRRFAKRQFTWFKSHSDKWGRVTNNAQKDHYRHILPQNNV